MIQYNTILSSVFWIGPKSTFKFVKSTLMYTSNFKRRIKDNLLHLRSTSECQPDYEYIKIKINLNLISNWYL